MIGHNSMMNIFTIKIRTHLAQTRSDTMQTRHLPSKKALKVVKKGVILTGGYSDYYRKRPLYSMYLFVSIFYCFVDSVVFFTFSGISLQWSHRHLAGYLQCKVRLMHCMVLCIAYGEVSGLFLCFGAI